MIITKRGKARINGILRRVHLSKAISILYSGRVSVALVILHKMGMRHTIFSPVTCLAVPYFSALSHKRQDFRKKVIAHEICVLILSTNCV
jgi:hypothetical protein